MRRIHKAIGTVAIALLLPVAASAGGEGRWLHVRVDDEGEKVRINLPLSVVTAVLPLIEEEEFHRGRLVIEGCELDRRELATLLEEIRKADDGEWIVVEEHHEEVRVIKEGRFLRVEVDEDLDGEHGESVRVRVPLEVLEALTQGEGDELDLLAAIEKLAEYGGGDLVTVNDRGTSVRIWIDDDSAGEEDRS